MRKTELSDVVIPLVYGEPPGTLVSHLGWKDVQDLVGALARRLLNDGHKIVYGIRRGGAIVAGLLLRCGVTATDEVAQASALVDDVIDSGATAKRWSDEELKPVYALIDKDPDDGGSSWVVFPWEESDPTVDAADHVARLLETLNVDVRDPGLRDTPKRVVALYQEMTSGRSLSVDEILSRTFEAASDEIVVVRDLPYYSLCEHHLTPFFGTVTVGYLPDRAKRGTRGGAYAVLGLSKIARLVYAFTRRLQLQERLTYEIAAALHESPDLRPRGVGVVVTGQHLCMKMRGVRSDGEMVTSALLGMFRDNADVRAEWLNLSRR